MSTATFQQLSDVIKRVFNRDDLEISRETRSVDVPGWDSLSHVMLILDIQSEFDVDIQPDETVSLANVGALYDLILEKSNPPAQ